MLEKYPEGITWQTQAQQAQQMGIMPEYSITSLY